MKFSKHPMKFKRRHVLKGLMAGSLVSMPVPRFAQSLSSEGLAWADGGGLPSRFGLWFFGNGTEPNSWHPAGNGGTGNDWELTEQLSPLADFKSHLTVLSRFELVAADLHYGGSAVATTGVMSNNFGATRLASIDQIVANLDHVKAGTSLQSLQVGLCKATPTGPEPTLFTVSHAAPSTPIYPEYDPHILFARLFGLSATAPELREGKLSVLDAVLEDLNALKAQLGAEDRLRLNAHTEGVRQLERRLSGQVQSCTTANQPSPEVRPDFREEAPLELNRIMGELMVTAMACDVTNVWSYLWTLPAGQVYYRSLGADFDRTFHNDIVHRFNGNASRRVIRRGVQYAMQSFAAHLDLLANTQTPTGDSLLDEICILCTSEVSYGWSHRHDNHPVIIAGKACGKLKGDQHWYGGNQQQNYSRVLLTLANLMGANVNSYGFGRWESNNPINDILA